MNENQKFEFILKKFKEAISEWEKDLKALPATLEQKSNWSEWKQWLDEKMYESDFQVQQDQKNIEDKFLSFIKFNHEKINNKKKIMNHVEPYLESIKHYCSHFLEQIKSNDENAFDESYFNEKMNTIHWCIEQIKLITKQMKKEDCRMASETDEKQLKQKRIKNK